MVVRKRTKSKTKQREEPEFGWQNISLWDSKTGKSALNGKITFTPEFLDNLLAMVEEEEIEVDDRGYITLAVSIRDNDNESRNAPIYLGSIWVPETQEEEKPAKKTTSRRRKAADDDEDEEDEDDVDPRRRKTRTARTRR